MYHTFYSFYLLTFNFWEDLLSKPTASIISTASMLAGVAVLTSPGSCCSSSWEEEVVA